LRSSQLGRDKTKNISDVTHGTPRIWHTTSSIGNGEVVKDSHRCYKLQDPGTAGANSGDHPHIGVGQFRVERWVSLLWKGGSVSCGQVGQFAWNTHQIT